MTHLEEVEVGAGVQSRGLVNRAKECSLLRWGLFLARNRARRDGRVQVNLEARDDVVFELNERSKRVCGRPTLSEREPVLAVSVLRLAESGDDTCGCRVAGNLEGDARRGGGLDLERSRADGEVLAEQVTRGLAKVLNHRKKSASASLYENIIIMTWAPNSR